MSLRRRRCRAAPATPLQSLKLAYALSFSVFAVIACEVLNQSNAADNALWNHQAAANTRKRFIHCRCYIDPQLNGITDNTRVIALALGGCPVLPRSRPL